MIPDIAAQLFDEGFNQKIDTDAAARYLQFSCGRALKLATMELVPGTPDMYITKTTRYPYPMEEINSIEQKLRVEGIDLVALLSEINDWEKAQITPIVNYPQRFADALDKVCDIDGMHILRVIYDMFEDWPTFLYRGGKIPTCAIFNVPVEVFAHDRGDDGDNGKTLLQVICGAVAGDYYVVIDESMLTHKPPHASAPNAALMSLVGGRLFGTPEVEEGLSIQSAWMKKLADPSTVWCGKEPYGTLMIFFRCNALLGISTNAKLLFTRLDAGVARRGIACSWKFSFKKYPKPNTSERQASDLNLKDPIVLAPFIPGYLYFMKCLYKAFYMGGYHKTPGACPQPILTATEELCHEELKACIVEVIDADFISTTNKGMSFTAIKAHLTNHRDVKAMTNDLKQIESILHTLVRPRTIRGSLWCQYENHTGYHGY